MRTVFGQGPELGQGRRPSPCPRLLEVVVARDRRVSRLRLVPATWDGAGLIGFKIRPVAEDEGVDR